MAWFDAEKRDLPWRRTKDPYRVWISEIMLQQTRVETVVPYYEKFLRLFPDVAALAAAELDEVLAAWSGLGYYRRARFLHAAARLVADSGEPFPDTLEGLRELPGIGEYTAAAIASIAFGVAEPVLDGNVERVIARVTGEAGDVKRAAVRRELQAFARDLLVEERPGDTNEALMELGATLCTPRGPRCSACPWAAPCVARATGDPEALPTPRARRRREKVYRTLLVVEEEGSVLLFRRSDDDSLLAGTWELPSIDGVRDSKRAVAEGEAELAERYGERWSIGSALGTLRHSITYRDLEVVVREASLGEEPGTGSSAGAIVRESSTEAGRFREEELDSIALSSLVRKALALRGRT